MPAYGGPSSRGIGGSEYAPPSGPPPPGGDYRGEGAAVGEKKNNDKRNMLIGAAGGLAVGAVGAAVIAEALGMFSRLYQLMFPKLLPFLVDTQVY